MIVSPLPDFERSEAGRRPRAAGPALALAAMTLTAYVPAIRGGYIWDDPDYVLNNEHLRSVEGLGRIWVPRNTPQYYPLVFTTFWIEYHLWGIQPLGYHLTNVLLHAVSAILVWRLLRGLNVPGAWCCAAVFAVHPVHAESVAWITERKNVLSGVFYLLAMGWFLRYESRPSWPQYAAALALFLLALLSKTVTCTLPAALLVLGWYRRGRIGARDLARVLPFLIVGSIFGLLTVVLEREHVGAEGADWALTSAQRVVLAGRALWFYAGKLVAPIPLIFVYPRWEPDALRGAMWVAPLGAAGALVTLWALRGRIGRGPAAGATFFAVTLFPALGFFDVFPFRYSFVADHFQYLASLGLIAPAVGSLARVFSERRARAWGLGPLAGAATLALLAGLTWRQCLAYQDEESLWRDTLAKNPSAWMAHFNLGLVFERRGDGEAAFKEYLETVRWRPQHHKAHTLLARDYTVRGDLDGAIRHYKAALEADPGLLTPNINLGNIYVKQGRYREAIALYKTAISVRAESTEAHFALANAYLAMGAFADAAEHYSTALEHGEDDGATRANLGMSLLQLGRLEAAVEQFERALALDAGQIETRLLLAGVLSRQRDYAGAAAVLRAGIERTPDDVRLSSSLSWILATCPNDAVRDGFQALRLAETVLERSPGPDAGAFKTLAAALAETGRWDEAIRAAKSARALAAAAGDARQTEQIERMIAAFHQHRPFRPAD